MQTESSRNYDLRSSAVTVSLPFVGRDDGPRIPQRTHVFVLREDFVADVSVGLHVPAKAAGEEVQRDIIGFRTPKKMKHQSWENSLHQSQLPNEAFNLSQESTPENESPPICW